jgi:hypothetical protein
MTHRSTQDGDPQTKGGLGADDEKAQAWTGWHQRWVLGS